MGTALGVEVPHQRHLAGGGGHAAQLAPHQHRAGGAQPRRLVPLPQPLHRQPQRVALALGMVWDGPLGRPGSVSVSE